MRIQCRLISYLEERKMQWMHTDSSSGFIIEPGKKRWNVSIMQDHSSYLFDSVSHALVEKVCAQVVLSQMTHMHTICTMAALRSTLFFFQNVWCLDRLPARAGSVVSSCLPQEKRCYSKQSWLNSGKCLQAFFFNFVTTYCPPPQTYKFRQVFFVSVKSWQELLNVWRSCKAKG